MQHKVHIVAMYPSTSICMNIKVNMFYITAWIKHMCPCILHICCYILLGCTAHLQCCKHKPIDPFVGVAYEIMCPKCACSMPLQVLMVDVKHLTCSYCCHSGPNVSGARPPWHPDLGFGGEPLKCMLFLNLFSLGPAGFSMAKNVNVLWSQQSWSSKAPCSEPSRTSSPT